MPQATDDFQSLPIDADRLCEGISKIGYRPSAALMDIGDNSITAKARHVHIGLDLRSDASLSTKGGISCFRVWDDGPGMTDNQVKGALQLGSSGGYPANSLSKFGLGLKSAGFSLGRRISILSKRDGALSRLWVLDRDVIRERGAYGAFSEDPSPALQGMLADVTSGTVVEVTKVLPRQDSANRVRRELMERLGVTYRQFLSQEEDPLRITLGYGAKTEVVEPVDILFLADAKPAFDPDDYDCKFPVRALDIDIENPLAPEGPKMRLEVAFFPTASMTTHGADDAERVRLKSYLVGRGNDGFFFYRNGRLIVWGDHFAGVTRNDITFRARLSFTDAHDDLLHVDVSKQHLVVPEEVEEVLRTAIRIPLAQSRHASQLCTRRIREGHGTEGEEFNRLTEVFEEEDPDETAEAAPPVEVRRRRREALDKASKAVDVGLAQEAADVAPVPAEPVPDAVEAVKTAFERVRYSTGITGSNVATAGYDPDYESYVRINKNHPFYQLVLNPLPAADKLRLAFESLLFAAAVAENKTIQNAPASIEVDVLRALFDKYRRTLGQNLEGWLSSKQDLFE